MNDNFNISFFDNNILRKNDLPAKSIISTEKNDTNSSIFNKYVEKPKQDNSLPITAATQNKSQPEIKTQEEVAPQLQPSKNPEVLEDGSKIYYNQCGTITIVSSDGKTKETKYPNGPTLSLTYIEGNKSITKDYNIDGNLTSIKETKNYEGHSYETYFNSEEDFQNDVPSKVIKDPHNPTLKTTTEFTYHENGAVTTKTTNSAGEVEESKIMQGFDIPEINVVAPKPQDKQEPQLSKEDQKQLNKEFDKLARIAKKEAKAMEKQSEKLEKLGKKQMKRLEELAQKEESIQELSEKQQHELEKEENKTLTHHQKIMMRHIGKSEEEIQTMTRGEYVESMYEAANEANSDKKIDNEIERMYEKGGIYSKYYDEDNIYAMGKELMDDTDIIHSKYEAKREDIYERIDKINQKYTDQNDLT